MNHSPVSMKSARRGTSRNDLDTRFRGYWLVLARMLWITLAVLILTLYVVGFPATFQYLTTLCDGSGCSGSQLTLEQARAFQAHGLSLDFYAAYVLAFELVFVLVWFLVATVIFWRKSHERLAWFVSLALLTFGATFVDVLTVLPQQQPVWWFPVHVVLFFGVVSFVLCFYLFPDGRFSPRWTRLLGILWFLWNLYWMFQVGAPMDSPLWGRSYGVVLGIGVFAQIYRYRRVSDPIQRQQSKWVVYGFTGAIVAFLTLVVGGLTLPSSLVQSPLSPLLIQPAYYVFMLLIPLSIGMAILRSRLWDIDVLINRTLVYGMLTALLALVYVGLVLALQFLLGGVIHQNNDISIVGSTLAIAALFQPLRRGVQRVIDRRFYRRKYDAARTLTAFKATLRNEVDLNQLSEQLVAVVQETMQPAHISLWLSKPHQEGTSKTKAWLSNGLVPADEERGQ